jgi:parvulin-like peptidyl-prolyl isomerase
VSRYRSGLAVVAGCIFLVAPLVLAQTRGAKGDAIVARVGRFTISRGELDDRVEVGRRTYRERTGQVFPDAMDATLRRTVLEQLIRADLIMLEAEKEGLLVSDAEATEELKRAPVFQESGQFSQSRFETLRLQNPKQFKAALEQTRLRVSGARLSQRVEQRQMPEEAKLKAGIERELTSASIDVLALPFDSFEGGGNEPAEVEILDYYRKHPEEFRRPGVATLTILTIDAERGADGAEDERRAEDTAAKAKADSLLAVAKEDGDLESLSRDGRLLRGVEVRRGDFPAYWNGDEQNRVAVFAAGPGTLLDEPVRGKGGWLLVRVDGVSQSGMAPLADVALEIRRKLRQRSGDQALDAALRDLYKRSATDLRGPQAHIRYAYFEASAIQEPKPSVADLDRFYRGHLADYSAFDAALGQLRQKPFDEVKEDVHARWIGEERLRLAYAAADRVLGAWSANKRERRAEEEASLTGERGPVPLGAPVDTLRFGAQLGDTLAARGGQPGVGMITLPGGRLVFQIFGLEPDALPPFEVVRPKLESMRGEIEDRTEREEARKMYDRDPMFFATDSSIHVSRILVPLPSPIDVPLTRQEVERYHKAHIEKYSAPEVVGARHILIAPGGPGQAADQAARLKAQGILRRIKAGEDFNELARQYSDDLATRESGGDLGTFGRGSMDPGFERAAFSMRPGDVSDLVKTPKGYDIIKCTSYEPVESLDLSEIYANVGFDAATEKGRRITQARADSLLRTIRSPSEALRKAKESNFILYHNQRTPGDPAGLDELRSYMHKLDEMKPGEIYPGTVYLRGQGYVITWVDSISAPRAPGFERSEQRVIDEYRRRHGASALQRKRAELDSLLSHGWSLDSLGTLLGGLNHMEEVRAGDSFGRLGGADQLDSLLFGKARAPALEPGQTSGWVAVPGGLVRVRLIKRLQPSPEQVASRMERDRRKELERNLYFYFEQLRQQFDVRILDPELASIPLPAPGGASDQ